MIGKNTYQMKDGAGALIGITTTVPVEIIIASGRRPVDLNNLFISAENPNLLLSRAEAAGFSHNICAWIKGIYSCVLEYGIKEVIAVTGGDCSNTVALGELLAREGVRVISFDYPLDRSKDAMKEQMERLIGALDTNWTEVDKVRERLRGVRKKLEELDRMTWKDNLVSGFENHLYLVCSTDFNGDPDSFERELDKVIGAIKKRKPRDNEVRLGYLGVPPIFSNFYELIESKGGRVVFNEVQRQFSMPYHGKGVLDQYLEYTYPYDAEGRIKDIEKAVEERRLDGLIHYTQTFCYRQIYDIMLRESLKVPILTLEGDRPGRVDSRTALRIETFLEMLSDSFI